MSFEINIYGILSVFGASRVMKVSSDILHCFFGQRRCML